MGDFDKKISGLDLGEMYPNRRLRKQDRQNVNLQAYLYQRLRRLPIMPQLSLSLDQDTFKKIVLAARKEKVSISQWVKMKLQNSFEGKWPEHFFQLYGSIEDESFQKPVPLHFKQEDERNT